MWEIFRLSFFREIRAVFAKTKSKKSKKKKKKKKGKKGGSNKMECPHDRVDGIMLDVRRI